MFLGVVGDIAHVNGIVLIHSSFKVVPLKMSVWVCGCVGVCMCGCVGMCMCGYVHVWVCACVGVWVCACVGMCMCGRVHVCMCGCVHMWVCGCACVHGRADERGGGRSSLVSLTLRQDQSLSVMESWVGLGTR